MSVQGFGGPRRSRLTLPALTVTGGAIINAGPALCGASSGPIISLGPVVRLRRLAFKGARVRTGFSGAAGSTDFPLKLPRIEDQRRTDVIAPAP